VNYWYIVTVMEIREQLIVGSVNTEDKKRSKLARSDRHACYCIFHLRAGDSRGDGNAKICSIVVTKGAAFPATLSSIHGSLAVRTILFQQGRESGSLAGVLRLAISSYGAS
jgi:hypothetical protein